MNLKKILIIILPIIIVVSIIAYFLFKETDIKTFNGSGGTDFTEEVVEEIKEKDYKIIGNSVEGRKIDVYEFGSGENNLLFVGGIHGGYEWNSVLLAYQMIDYFDNNIDLIPDDISISIIPSLNPDGLYDVIGKEGRFEVVDVQDDEENGLGRFNANNVDLNRNFDCKWAPESSWKGNIVSAGEGPFSEPEALTLFRYVGEVKPNAVVFWHSKANTVYASECENGVLPQTVDIMNLYAAAGGYNSVESFDAYPITGDAEGWLASIGIPAITVELETRDSTEFSRNLAGVKSIINYYQNL